MSEKTKTRWFVCAALFFLFAAFCLSDKAFSSDEFTRVGQANTTGTIKEFHLTAPANLAGRVNLEVGEEDVCSVEFECWAEAKNSKMAKEFTELVELHLETVDEVATLTLSTPRDAPWEGTNYAIRVNLDVYIPPDIVLETKPSSFELDITGPLKKAYIKNRYGNVQLEDVSEETDISGSYIQVEVENIEGPLDIETSYNSIRVRDADTRDGRAYLKTTYGKIEVEQFTGQLEASTVYSPIHCSGLSLLEGENQIRTMYSTIDLEIDQMEDCGLFVTNSYGNINLTVPEDLSARLRLSVGRGGKINTDRILIRPLVLDKTRLEGICGDGESNIGLQVNGIGRIQIEGR